jgi:hypothetical protein
MKFNILSYGDWVFTKFDSKIWKKILIIENKKYPELGIGHGDEIP